MIRTKHTLIAASLATALLGSVGSADAARTRQLKTTKGTMQLGGALSVAVNTVAPKRGDNLNGVVLSVSPSFGYFVVDGLELNLPLIVDLRLGKLYNNISHSISFLPGLRYIFATGTRVHPFVGINLGPKFMIPDPDSNADTTVALSWRTPAGILIALNKNVGLTVGLALDVTFGFNGQTRYYPNTVPGSDVIAVEFLLGYLGVEAFF